MSKVQTISLKRNNDRNLNLTFKKDDLPLDITGYTIYFTAKYSKSQTDIEALIDETVTVHTNPTAGLSTIAISAVDTAEATVGNYYCDVLLVDGSGKRQSSKTFILELVHEVTDGDS